MSRLAKRARDGRAGQSGGPEVERVLATVLFTDIVGSTARAAEHRVRLLLRGGIAAEDLDDHSENLLGR